MIFRRRRLVGLALWLVGCQASGNEAVPDGSMADQSAPTCPAEDCRSCGDGGSCHSTCDFGLAGDTGRCAPAPDARPRRCSPACSLQDCEICGDSGACISTCGPGLSCNKGRCALPPADLPTTHRMDFLNWNDCSGPPPRDPHITVEARAGILSIEDASTTSGHYIAYRWEANTMDRAYVEARLKVEGAPTKAGVVLLVADGTHKEVVSFYKDKIEFYHRPHLAYSTATTDDFHLYRVEISGDDIALFMDGALVIDGADAFTHPADLIRGNQINRIGFGSGGGAALGKGLWDWVEWSLPPLDPDLEYRSVRQATHSIVYKEGCAFTNFPTLYVDPNDVVYASFGSRGSAHHAGAANAWINAASQDEGRTWRQIGALPANATRVEEPINKVFEAGGDPNVLITVHSHWWRWYDPKDYPDPEASAAANLETLKEKHYVMENVPGRVGQVATITGGYLERSDYDGEKWVKTKTEIPELETYTAVGTGWCYAQLADADKTVLAGIAVREKKGDPVKIVIVATTDGLTYRIIDDVLSNPRGEPQMTNECRLHVTDEGSIWLLARTHRGIEADVDYFYSEYDDDYMWQAVSHDNGQTWTRRRTHLRGHPPSGLVELADGRLVLTYGYRHPPYGIHAAISLDQGLTWGDEIIVLRADGYTYDIGYPYSSLLPSGHILTVYYFSGEEAQSYIAATRWLPPGL